MKNFFKYGWLLLLTPYYTYADPWQSESLGDGIALAALTFAILIYAIIYLTIAVFNLTGKAIKKGFKIYNTLSFALYLFFFLAVINYFIKYPPNGWQQLLINGGSEGTLKIGWMNVVILIAMFMSIYYIGRQLKKHSK